MTSHHDKNLPQENPVGPTEPLVKLDIPLWQVLVALFLIALVLTAFKVYERNNIAPGKPVQFRELDRNDFRQEQLQRRNMLVWTKSAAEEDNAAVLRLFDTAEVRTAVYMNRFLCWDLALQENPEEERKEIEKDWSMQLDPGQLLRFIPGERQPRTLSLEPIDQAALLEFIEN